MNRELLMLKLLPAYLKPFLTGFYFDDLSPEITENPEWDVAVIIQIPRLDHRIFVFFGYPWWSEDQPGVRV